MGRGIPPDLLADGLLPPAKYFLIATLERIFGWKQENLTVDIISPHFTIDAGEALSPYLGGVEPKAYVAPEALRLAIFGWLAGLSRSHEDEEVAAYLKPLAESGLLAALRRAEIEMNG